MNRNIHLFSIKFFRELVSSIFIFTSLMGVVGAQAQDVTDYSSVPPLAVEEAPNPLVMLTLSNDHQLYFKAYNDFDDIWDDPNTAADDNLPDITYTHNYSYIGYFDHKKCYVYANGLFSPTANAPTNDTANGIVKNQYCSDSEWSGNFLNWATMTRVDLVRQVLYGGRRVVDTATATVLERSYLPNDAHSFAKHYDGADINKLTAVTDATTKASCSALPAADQMDCFLNSGITMCNTTKHPSTQGVFSQNIDTSLYPPLMRLVKGNYSFWASGERLQCLYGPTDTSTDTEIPDIGDEDAGRNGNDPSITGIYANEFPPAASEGSDFYIRVSVCGANSADGAHNCQAYGNNKKPEGVLQKYGADGKIKFGLMTGGYNTNKHFGVLRKNVDSIAAEFNATTGVFARPTNSLINTLDAFRVVDYQFHHDTDANYRGTYNEAASTGGGCFWGWNAFNNGQCRNWGNPFNELLAESYRYFAGAANGNLLASDAGLLPGLAVENWVNPVDPQASGSECVSMNVVGFNASYVSYDSDFGSSPNVSVAGLGIGSSAATIGSLTDTVGQAELGTSKYFVGNSDTAANGRCSPKTINSLSSVKGVCPEAPRLDGSFLSAGLSHYVHTNDVLPNVQGENTIETVGVTLAGNLPQITIPIPGMPGSNINVLPACRNDAIGGNCAIVDFKVLRTHSQDGGTGPYKGKYFVGWEDSEQGGDFDTDVNGIIEYEIEANQLRIYTRIIYESTTQAMGFGFVIAGVSDTEDDYYLPSGIEGFNSAEFGCDALVNCSDAPVDGDYAGTQVTTFSLDTSMIGGVSPVKNLETPLYYAAKYGSFEDLNGNSEPDQDLEWDDNGDSVPDAYLLVTDPGRLQVQLNKALDQIIYRPATSTSSSVTVSSVLGEGLTLATLYQPKFSNQGKSVSWVGTLSGLFTDPFGNIREDSDGNKQLTETDKIVEFIGGEVTRINRYPINADGTPDVANVELELPVESLIPLWDARNELANLTDAQAVNQRTYGNSAATGRYIFTGVDELNNNTYDGQIVSTEVTPFTVAEVTAVNSTLAPLFDATDIAHAEDILRFIRGQEGGLTNMRSREVNWGDGLKTWRLGDIVNSSAAVVSRPNQPYDILYGDDSYAAYRDAYRERRQVVYVGANDGLLHAFNAGFFNPNDVSVSATKTGFTAHPLGAELWAYAPYNLLPHLKWLTESSYQNEHVFYVDAEVKQYDVNIFPADNTHVGGWGTIIVVGMRLGGGEYTLDPDGSGPRGDTTLRSAFIVLDVTNPEVPPTLLGEISDADIGFTTSKTTVVKQRQPSTTGSYLNPQEVQKNNWFLVFGSGPQGNNALRTGLSDSPAKLFTLDLKALVNGDVSLVPTVVDAATAQSFVGGPSAADWDADYQDDMVYFGIVGDGTNSRGALKHAQLAFSASEGVTPITNVANLLAGTGSDLAFSVPPLTVRDRSGNYWVYTGSGRFYVQDDLALMQQDSYFGLKVNNPQATTNWLQGSGIGLTDLKNMSAVKLYINDLGGYYVADPDAPTDTELDDIIQAVDSAQGWYRTFATVAESNFTRSALDESTLAFSTYTPAVSVCQPSGNSLLYVLDMFTGLPQYKLRNPFKNNSDTLSSDGKDYTALSETAGSIDGMASDTVIVIDKAFTKNDKGETTVTDLEPTPAKAMRRSWREISIDEIL